MKNAIKEKKKIIIISIVILLILLIGIAFAYLVTTLYGEKEYIVRAGSLGLELEENNELTLEKVIPIEDSEGLTLNGFNFSLVNNGNIETDYTIYLDDIPLDEGETRMPDSAIRYSLTKNEEMFMSRNLTTMGSDPNRRVDFGRIGVDETINYTLRIWIDYDATTEEASGKTFKGKLRVVASQSSGEEVSEVLLANIPEENQFDDGVDTFITGEDPNNYIWYSGKLWRVVSVNNEEKTVKLVTQWNISAINYSSGSSAFEGSYMEEWLNDTSVDGFLGNLRNYENFIVTDAKWDATMDNRGLGSIERPNWETTVTDAVGLLNIYEYQSSNNGETNGYLNNGLLWWTLTPDNTYSVQNVYDTGNTYIGNSTNGYGIRPSINLKSTVKIVSGNGTEEEPYKLYGDNDSDLSGTMLNTRYSGEYIRFGTGENTLYRIVSHETRGLTKITSAEPLKDSGIFITSVFGNDTTFSSTNTIGAFLNGDYLTTYVGNNYNGMIENNTTWYLGTIGIGTSYKLGKYTDTNMSLLTLLTTTANVGLLRMGELMSGQFDRYTVKEGTSGTVLTTNYWTLTPSNDSYIRFVYYNGDATNYRPTSMYGVKPSLNLKSNVVITGGDGTKENPFTIELQ